MNDAVSGAGDLFPRDDRVSFPFFGCNSGGGFADDLNEVREHERAVFV